MKKSTIITLIVAGVLIGTGIIMIAVSGMNGGMSAMCWDKQEHRIVAYNQEEMQRTQNKIKIEAFDSIQISSWDANVELIPSDDYYIEYCVSAPEDFNYSIIDGKLVFAEDNSRYLYLSWGDLFDSAEINGDRYVKVYYPSDADMYVVDIDLDMGSVSIDSLNIGSADIDLDMGTLVIKNSYIGSMKAELDMGSLDMENVTVSGAINAELDMGSANLMMVGKDNNGESIKYGYKLETDMGNVSVNGGKYDSGHTAYLDGNVMINISCDMGDIELKLE